MIPTGGTSISSRTIRASARNPGTGAFHGNNFNTALYRFSIAGGVPADLGEAVENGKASYGLACDTLWGFDQDSPIGGTTDLVEFNEVDKTTGFLAGRTCLGFTPGVTNIAGGCEIFDDGSGKLKIIGSHQDSADAVAIHELVLTAA